MSRGGGGPGSIAEGGSITAGQGGTNGGDRNNSSTRSTSIF